MENDNNDKKMETIYSKRLRAGKRRTYFFDVRSTKGNDYYLTITESRKRFDDNGYDRHKVFLYKEDFNKFIKALNEAIDYVKTELMPDFNFDAFNHDEYDEEHSNGGGYSSAATGVVAATVVADTPEVSEDANAPEAALPPVEEAADNDEKIIENPAPKTSEDDELPPTNHEEVEKW